MNHTRTEIIVGLFVLVGIACLGYLAIKLGKLEVFGASGYTVTADFPSVAGLKVGDPVEIAGVRVGRVEALGLSEDERAQLKLRNCIGAGARLDRRQVRFADARRIGQNHPAGRQNPRDRVPAGYS